MIKKVFQSLFIGTGQKITDDQIDFYLNKASFAEGCNFLVQLRKDHYEKLS